MKANDLNNIFFDLIRVSLGSQGCLSRTPSAEEWHELYAMAKKQSILGICFVGVQRLKRNEQQPDELLYIKWMGMAAKIQRKNEKMNARCVELQEMLEKDGLRSCILKGQGVAALYNVRFEPGRYTYVGDLRQSGDIDVWIEGGFEKVNDWVQNISPTKIVNQHHVALDVFEDAEVEAHYHPINMMNPWRQKVLKAFIKEHEDECFANRVCLHDNLNHNDNPQMCVPTRQFNLVFLLVHIFHHLFTEGVGLRQVMDYYFALMARNSNENINDNENLRETLRSLGLERFASALMWVIAHVFAYDNENHNANFFFCRANEKDGRYLLKEIMLSGNFGKQDSRQKGLYKSKWNSFWMIHMKTFRFLRFDYWAWLWSPIERVRGYLWRRKNGYRQY